MHQDKYGFIWMGTVVGLNLYNGYEVTLFNAEPKKTEAIFNNRINCIFEVSPSYFYNNPTIVISGL